MSGDLSSNSEIEKLADAFVVRFRNGERPSISEYVQKHPHLATEIEEIFPALVAMEQVQDEIQDHRTANSPPKTTAQLVPPTLSNLGDFKIVREIGRGGMGVVYEAEQVSLGRRVALKVLAGSLSHSPKSRSRFAREARAAAQLHHTNIVPVFGVGEQHDISYYVMQLIYGVGLDEVLQAIQQRQKPDPSSKPNLGETVVQQKANDICDTGIGEVSAQEVAEMVSSGQFTPTLILTPPCENSEEVELHQVPAQDRPQKSIQAQPHSSSFNLPGHSSESGTEATQKTYRESIARIGIQVAEALQHAHEQGIYHRDIKPANLLLDAHGTVWVTDFGLAKAVGQDDLTNTGDVVGTLRYMAPEQFSGTSDARSDIYALGLTLYEMIALRPAFDQADRQQLIKAVTSELPPHLPMLTQLPRDLATIIHKAIEREPSLRYQSAAELAEDLQRFLNDEPIRARRISIPARLHRWYRRNPSIAWLVTAIALLLTTALVVAIIAAVKFEALADYNSRLVDDKTALASDLGTALDQSKASLLRAREAVDRLLTRIGDDRLTNIPRSEQIRRGILEDALEIYEGLLSESDRDLEISLETARAKIRVARIYHLLDQDKQNRKAAINSAISIYEDLVAKEPESSQLRFELAEALMEMPTRADRDRSKQIIDKLLQEQPTNPHYLSLKIDIDASSAAHLLRNGVHEAAMELYQETIDFAETLKNPWPENTALSLGNLYLGYGSAGQQSVLSEREALAVYQSGVTKLTRVLKEQSHSRPLRAALGRLYSQVTQLQKDIGEGEKSIETANLAVETFRNLTIDFPDVVHYQLDYAHALFVRFLLPAAENQDRIDYLKKSIEVATAVVEQNPENGRATMLAARSIGARGHAYWGISKLEEAKDCFSKAKALRDNLLQHNPVSNFNVAESSYDIWLLGHTYEQLGEADVAIDFYLSEAEIREKFLGGWISVDDFINDGINCLKDAARLLRERGDFAAAAEALQRVEPFYQERADQFDTPYFLREKVELWTDVSSLWQQAGDEMEAEKCLAKLRERVRSWINDAKDSVATGQTNLDELTADINFLINDIGFKEDLLSSSQRTGVNEEGIVLGLELTQLQLAILNTVEREVEKSVFTEDREQLMCKQAVLRADLLGLQGKLEDAADVYVSELTKSDIGEKELAELYNRLIERHGLFAAVASKYVLPVEIWNRRAEWCVRRGDWQNVRKAYEHLESPLLLPHIQFLCGDIESYIETCRKRLTNLRKNQSPDAGDYFKVTNAVSLSPSSEFDRGEILEWAENLVDARRDKFTLRELAIAQYRNGQFEEALEIFDELENTPDVSLSAIAFPRAMAFHAVGSLKESMHWYRFGNEEMQNDTLHGTRPTSWAIKHWIEASIWKLTCERELNIKEIPNGGVSLDAVSVPIPQEE